MAIRMSPPWLPFLPCCLPFNHLVPIVSSPVHRCQHVEVAFATKLLLAGIVCSKVTELHSEEVCNHSKGIASLNYLCHYYYL